jgi:hypothetical protein
MPVAVPAGGAMSSKSFRRLYAVASHAAMKRSHHNGAASAGSSPDTPTPTHTGSGSGRHLLFGGPHRHTGVGSVSAGNTPRAQAAGAASGNAGSPGRTPRPPSQPHNVRSPPQATTGTSAEEMGTRALFLRSNSARQ